MKNGWYLLGFILLSQAAGLIGSLVTSPEWYAELVRPDIAPPSWVFGPVWITLYFMMGIAAYLVWRKPQTRLALGAFFFQLVLNACWSIIFFGFRSIEGALIEIVLLWIAIAATIAFFARHSLTAALLLVPYLLWVTFATYLTYSIWLLN